MTDTRDAFEAWMLNTAKIIVGSSDPYPAGMERDNWRTWQAATQIATLAERERMADSLAAKGFADSCVAIVRGGT